MLNLPYLLVFSFFLLYGNQLHAQKEPDYSDVELRNLASQSLENWNYYLRNNLDSLKVDAFNILVIGVENDNDFAINVGKRSLGSYFIRTGKPLEGIKYLKESLSYFEKNDDLILQTEILNEIGNGYLNFGKPADAEKFYLKSLRTGKESPDPTSSFLAESNLAQAYLQLGNPTKAKAILTHYKKESLKHGKLESVSNAYALLGTIEQGKGNYILAKEYYRKSSSFGFKSKSHSQIAHAYNNMAIVLFQENKHAESLEYFERALEMRIRSGNVRSISESYFNLGEYYRELKNFILAKEFYEKSEKFCIVNNLIKERLDAVLAQAELLEIQGIELKAIEEYKRYQNLLVEFYSHESSKKSEDTEFILSLENLEKDKSSKTKEAKMSGIIEDWKSQTRILYIACLLSLTALIFLAFYKRGLIKSGRVS